MTHRERLETALNLGQPDQVPVTWELVDRCALAFTGRTGWRAQCDAHRMIGSAIFNLQGVGPQIFCRLPSGYREESREVGVEDGWRVDEYRLTTPQGTLTSVTKHGGIKHDPLIHKNTERLIKTRDDWEVYADYLDAWNAHAGYGVSEAAAARDYIGDDGLVGHWCADALYSLSSVRREADFILDLLDLPDTIDDLLRKVHQRIALAIRAFNESAAEVLIYDICWASTSLINPELCERLVVPEAKWAVESIKPGKYIVFFTSGKIRDVLPMLVACKPHGIQHLDVLGDCDLAEVKQSFGDQVCLIGNYSPVVLAHGTVEEARIEARRCIRAAAEGGAYFVSTSDEVPGDAKLDNMRAVVEVAETEGRY